MIEVCERKYSADSERTQTSTLPIKGVSSDQSEDQVRRELELSHHDSGRRSLVAASPRIGEIGHGMVVLPLRPPVDQWVELPLRQVVDRNAMVSECMWQARFASGEIH